MSKESLVRVIKGLAVSAILLFVIYRVTVCWKCIGCKGSFSKKICLKWNNEIYRPPPPHPLSLSKKGGEWKKFSILHLLLGWSHFTPKIYILLTSLCWTIFNPSGGIVRLSLIVEYWKALNKGKHWSEIN